MGFTADIISFDPTDIIIQRHTKVPNAGGFAWSVSDVTSFPITVRLYFITSRNMREVTLPEGEVKTIVLGMLAEWGTDIVVSHLSYDTFVFESRTYRVVGAREYDDVNLPDNACQYDCVAV